MSQLLGHPVWCPRAVYLGKGPSLFHLIAKLSHAQRFFDFFLYHNFRTNFPNESNTGYTLFNRTVKVSVEIWGSVNVCLAHSKHGNCSDQILIRGLGVYIRLIADIDFMLFCERKYWLPCLCVILLRSIFNLQLLKMTILQTSKSIIFFYIYKQSPWKFKDMC